MSARLRLPERRAAMADPEKTDANAKTIKVKVRKDPEWQLIEDTPDGYEDFDKLLQAQKKLEKKKKRRENKK